MCCGQSSYRPAVPKKQVVPVAPVAQKSNGQIVAQGNVQQQQRERNFQRQIMAKNRAIIKR